MSPKDYAAYLRKRAKEIPEAVVMPAFRRRAFKVLELTIQNTPVNFGALRNGWHLTIGAPSGEDREGGKTRAGVLAAGKSLIDKVRFGEGIWIQNNVPYARVYEDGLFQPPDPGPSKATHVPKSRRKRVAGTALISGGFHVSAPNGMLADAVQQVARAGSVGGPVTVAAFENALRVAASTWAGVNGYAFAWDNGPPVDPRAAPTLVWSFRTASEERLTVDVVLAEGVATGTLWLPAGRGGLAALAVAKSLRDALAGLTIGGGETGKNVQIGPMRRDGPSLLVDVQVPWELDERRVVVGAVGPQGEATDVTAYQAFRERWEQLVRAPLGIRTFFDDSPPADDLAPPWCLATWRTLSPIPIERGRQRVPGRVIAALNLPIATGVQVANTAAPLIAAAFTDCTVRGVVFGTPVTTRVGTTPRNTWQTNVRLPFHFDQRT